MDSMGYEAGLAEMKMTPPKGEERGGTGTQLFVSTVVQFFG